MSEVEVTGAVYDPPVVIDECQMFRVLGFETDEDVIESVTLSYDFYEFLQ